jgi:hypothetical protein
MAQRFAVVCAIVAVLGLGLAAQAQSNRLERAHLPLVADGRPTGLPTTRPTQTPAPTQAVTPSITPMPSVTPTQTAGPDELAITFVQLLEDPAFPDEEFVEIESRATRPIDLTGWQLVNASRLIASPFVFPAFTIQPGFPILVYSTIGANDLEDGDFYWGQQPPLWQAGDRAELRDAAGNLVASYTVEEQ